MYENKVKTKFSKNTQDLGKYLHDRIMKAKDLNTLFKSLIRANYKIATRTRVLPDGTPILVSEITGNFNGNDWNVTVEYTEDNPAECEDGFKQCVIGVIY